MMWSSVVAALLDRWLDLWDEHLEYATAGQMLDAYGPPPGDTLT
jgi:hypothetical protein